MSTQAPTPAAQDQSPPVTGLSEAEAWERLRRGQSNAFQPRTTRSIGRILRDNTLTSANVVLVGIGILLAFIGEPSDALATGGLVLFNMVVGLFQEVRAKRQLDHLALLSRPKATVIRDGKERTLDPAEIVLGDVLVVRSGDQILVDGAVVGSGRMAVDESLLTGEADLVTKADGDPVYSGSYCMEGTATYAAQKVGADSLANRMTQDVRSFRRTKTVMQEHVDLLIRVMAVLTAALVTLFGVSSLVHSISPVQSVQTAAVILALIPQGLQTMIIVSYAMGAVRMSGSGVLIQQANAVESLSDINVLCSDKTGTLTTNALSLEATHPIGAHAQNLERTLGDFVASMPARNHTSDAIGAAYSGRPHAVADTVPFSSERKWSAAVFSDGDLHGAYVLGAPEVLKPALQPGDGFDRDVASWTAHGLRVLLFASAPDATTLHGTDGKPELPSNLIPLALLTFRDQLRPEAGTTLQRFADAGIRLKFISGDSPDTVAALVRQAGFPVDGKVIAGPDLDELDDAGVAQAAEAGSIFGRVTPQHKQRLVRGLRQNGAYVAMVGDGVNDVLALKEAQVGIAMESGSQMTRGVADIVLMGNSFAALPRAFREGQRIVQGMLDVMRVLLTRTLYMCLLVVGTAIVGVSFPFTPTTNSVVTMLTVGIPIVGLTAWARSAPRPRNTLLSLVRFIVPAAVTTATLLLTLYVVYIQTDGNLALARNVITVAGVMCGTVIILFVAPLKPFLSGGNDLSGDWRPTALALAIAVIFTALLFAPIDLSRLGLATLRVQDFGVIVLAVIVWAFVLRWMWRVKIFERWLGLDGSESTDATR